MLGVTIIAHWHHTYFSVNDYFSVNEFEGRGRTPTALYLTTQCNPFPDEGDIGVYGDAVLDNFSCGISVISILTCGIAVLSRSSECGF